MDNSPDSNCVKALATREMDWKAKSTQRPSPSFIDLESSTAIMICLVVRVGARIKRNCSQREEVKSEVEVVDSRHKARESSKSRMFNSAKAAAATESSSSISTSESDSSSCSSSISPLIMSSSSSSRSSSSFLSPMMPPWVLPLNSSAFSPESSCSSKFSSSTFSPSSSSSLISGNLACSSSSSKSSSMAKSSLILET
ncbi:hypothetical protein WICPIJ_003142 [Wickerhamomyces pijperi]|uniref:Uncharacterized protein n=1 Tax=Wickerhamomyces pijperi TaxID=599730 RepID=A0A9P8QAG0_WICPI|nr:hypothetical protein WICPIJ_003142 [Wickerhamomyces pijperi]